jgi:hypothetical protein
VLVDEGHICVLRLPRIRENAAERQAATSSEQRKRFILETIRDERYNAWAPEIIGALAEGQWRIGHFNEAFLTINGIIARVTDGGLKYDLAELMRINRYSLAILVATKIVVAIEAVRNDTKVHASADRQRVFTLQSHAHGNRFTPNNWSAEVRGRAPAQAAN